MSVPVEFVIECRNERIESIGQSALSSHFSTTYGVLLRFYPKVTCNVLQVERTRLTDFCYVQIDGVHCQVNIRGQQEFLGRLKDAVQHFGHVTQTLLVIWSRIL